jgi:hypothetical protein
VKEQGASQCPLRRHSIDIVSIECPRQFELKNMSIYRVKVALFCHFRMSRSPHIPPLEWVCFCDFDLAGGFHPGFEMDCFFRCRARKNPYFHST